MTKADYPLYRENGGLWSLISPLESYALEMKSWVELIRERFGEGARLEVLDLGTGGGHHLYHIDRLYSGKLKGIAVDLSQVMLDRVEELLPQFETLVANMLEVNLGRSFPLLTVHDSFCYLTSLKELRRLAANVAKHLAPGGLALVKLEAMAGRFKGPYRYLTTFEDDEQEITLTHYEWDPDPQDNEIEVIYLFLQKRAGKVVSWEERHKLGIFRLEELYMVWSEVGLEAKLLELERWDEDRPNLMLAIAWAKVESSLRRNSKSS